MKKTDCIPWAGLQAREWQAAALAEYRRRVEADDDRGLIVAIMGAGKSILLAEIAATTPGRVIVTCPTLRLVRQLAATLRRRGLDVGEVCTGSRDLDRRVTVCTYDPRTLARVAGAHDTPPALWIADEAHRTNTAGIAAWRDEIDPVRSVGVTATPYLADEDEPLRLWRSVWFHYGLREAVRDGVVLLPTFASVRTADIVEGAREWLATVDGPGVFSAATKADADALAAALDGVESYHSGQTIAEREDRIERLRRGELRAIVHVSCLVEGVDLPWLRWIGLTHARGSRVAYAQEIGRVLRTAPDKDRVLVWDPWGAAEQHSLDDPATLGEALEEWTDAPAVPSLATMQIDTSDPEAPLLVGVFRHVADVIPVELLPCTCEVVDGGRVVHVEIGDGEIVTFDDGRPYPVRSIDPPGVLFVRHTLSIDLEIVREHVDTVAPVVTPAEALARSVALRLSVAGLCPPLVRWVRERRDAIERAGHRAGADSLRLYMRQTARREQIAWLISRLPDVTSDPALQVVRSVLYDSTPPRVVSAYACAQIIEAHAVDPETANHTATVTAHESKTI